MADETTLIQPAAAAPKKATKKDESTAEVIAAEDGPKAEVIAAEVIAPKRYAIKVGRESPVRSVRSASIIFTEVAQIFGGEDDRLAELKANPWLEVTEVTE